MMAGPATPLDSLLHSSPLESLVRRSSSRRARPSPPSFGPPSLTLPAPPVGSRRSPSSPLLHTHFRVSTATTSSADNASVYPSMYGPPQVNYQHDDQSIYSTSSMDRNSYGPATALMRRNTSDGQASSPRNNAEFYDLQSRASWESTDSDGTARASGSRETWRSSIGGIADPDVLGNYESPRIPLPMVVVSSPSDLQNRNAIPRNDDGYPHPPPVLSSTAQGKARAAVPNGYNFSRPVRLTPAVATALQEDEHKRQVLERNRFRSTPSLRSPFNMTSQSEPAGLSFQEHPPQPHHQAPQPPYPDTSQWTLYDGGRVSPESTRSETWPTGDRPGSRSPSPPPALLRSSSSSEYYDFPRTPPSQSTSLGPVANMSPSNSFLPPQTNNIIQLSNRPYSPRPASRASSIYSRYSFYELDGTNTPSPTSASKFPAEQKPENHPEKLKPHFAPAPTVIPTKASRSPTPMSKTAVQHPSSAAQPQSPEDFVQLGIQHHEANRLKESAYCFERSATDQGGCHTGMLMWGLTLRHAWGCAKDERAGFKWLQRAAEAAVDDLESAREGREVNASAVQSELILAIYEVGQCFFQGWGVPKDQKMGVSYFQVAARLGDPDAQQELAFCLANGRGCKKDRKEAAKWYRAAVAQGASDVGLAWIYKEKFS